MKKVTLQVLGEIGTEVRLEQVVAQEATLARADEIVLLVNSYGGSVFDGLAIYNYLKRWSDKITVEVLGVAASAASLIALAGDTLQIYDGAMVMVHEPWGGVIGTAGEMDDMAQTLRKIRDEMVLIYADRLGWSIDQAEALMAAETWMTGQELAASLGPGARVRVELVEREAQGVSALAASASRYGYKGPPVGRDDNNDRKEVAMSNTITMMTGAPQEQGQGMMDQIERLIAARLDEVLAKINAAAPKIEVPGPRVANDGALIARDGRELKSLGDYIAYAAKYPQDVRALVSRESDATDGYPIPKRYIDEIQRQAIAETVMLNNAYTIDGTLLSTTAPQINQGGTNGPGGGYGPSYKAEGADLDTTDPKMTEVVLTPYKFGGVTKLSRRLLEAPINIERRLEEFIRDEFVRIVELKTLSGTGTGEPQGVIGSSATINVTRAAANDVQAVDLQKMLSALTPVSRQRAVWIVSVDAAPKLFALVDNTKGQTVTAGMAQLTIYGLPVYFQTTVALGQPGDVLLVDPRAYAFHSGLGIDVSFSFDAGFQSDSLALKAVWYNDGKPRVKAPIQWATGKVISPFVRLGS